jgi:hypothetical protein
MDSSSRSRFIISLMLRNPEYVARMAAKVLAFYAEPENTIRSSASQAILIPLRRTSLRARTTRSDA